MFFFDLFGIFDLLSGIVFFSGEYIIAGALITFLGGFLVFKGITTMIKFPIWWGPIGFFAGIVDLVTGILMYFGDHAGWLARTALILSVFLILKGGITVLIGLVAR